MQDRALLSSLRPPPLIRSEDRPVTVTGQSYRPCKSCAAIFFIPRDPYTERMRKELRAVLLRRIHFQQQQHRANSCCCCCCAVRAVDAASVAGVSVAQGLSEKDMVLIKVENRRRNRVTYVVFATAREPARDDGRSIFFTRATSTRFYDSFCSSFRRINGSKSATRQLSIKRR
jgi:hypothetical protein